MKRAVLVAAVMLLFVASPAFAQRSGFTVLANVGVGFQNDEFYKETAIGVGLNFGAGVFLTEHIAVLGRFSGTSATFDVSGVRQASGVWGATVQFWVNNWASIEGGAGYGRWSDAFNDSDDGFGLIVAFQASVFRRGSHHIRAGFEYAPLAPSAKSAYTMIHNMAVVVGYQYARNK